MAANLTLANKNPFSTFDFLGYFIPGATYLSYLGYTKFYRRFTLENLMGLLVCKEFDRNKQKGCLEESIEE